MAKHRSTERSTIFRNQHGEIWTAWRFCIVTVAGHLAVVFLILSVTLITEMEQSGKYVIESLIGGTGGH